MFHYTVETRMSVDEAVQALEESLKSHQFGVLWKFDLTAKLEEKGLDFHRPYRILETCNPIEANGVLSQNSLAGYFLPCKIVVYEEDGLTKIGLPKPTTLIGILDDSQLVEVAERVESTLVKAIERAIQ